jgi:hypothetical protein
MGVKAGGEKRENTMKDKAFVREKIVTNSRLRSFPD